MNRINILPLALAVTTLFVVSTVKAQDNTAPTAMAQSINVIKNKSTTLVLSGSDVDNNTLSYQIVGVPQHGTLTGDAPNLQYTPTADYNGTDSFTFKVNDGTIDSQNATIAISVDNSPGRVLNGWWGNFNTNDYNPRNSLAVVDGKPNFNYIDPDSPEAPYPPSNELIAVGGRQVIAWVLYKNKPSDPLQQAGGVGGGNRTVTWQPHPPSVVDYRSVSGYFAEPDISRVVLTRRTNKPTYYYGLEGSINGTYIKTDAGIQWEQGGWTLINRVTMGVTGGRWDLFKQYAPS
ncbi:MAG: hypothetical protein EOO88_45735 [Pedobacter sp.]|nr:MAG: hypothetical protein EOO88_45735 [Pedobacter sp.]